MKRWRLVERGIDGVQGEVWGLVGCRSRRFDEAGGKPVTITWWPLAASLSYHWFMARVTSRTKLTELKARVGAASRHAQDGPARLVRSVQQSLRVEGYEVREEVLRSALRRATAGRAR
jgi:hypothetical protein